MAEQRTAWQLAQLADCEAPDSEDSPGAVWLRSIAQGADPTDHEVDDEDWIFEVADQSVPIYTHHRWEVFTDLGAWQEDISEYGGFENDLTSAAGVALLMIAERLIHALKNEGCDP